MNYIVIGSTGFIGSKIYASLKFDPKNSVVGISSNQVDLSNTDSYKKLKNIVRADSTIIMCAGVKKQLGDNIDIFEKNLIIINNFIRIILHASPQKIIFLSSASVYGEDVEHSNKIDENTLVENRSYYGMGKYMSEVLLTNACQEIKTELVILRPPLIYGDGDLSFGYGPTGFLRKALDGNEIIIWGDGTELREFVFIDDIVAVINILIDSKFYGVLNVISGRSYTYSDITRIISDDLGIDLEVSFQKRTKDKVDHRFSSERINATTHNFCFTSLESGIRLMHDSMQKNK
jgi:nucleoside-diphosphate-sugar epimerase